MTKTTKKARMSGFRRALNETARDMHRHGAIDDATLEKITKKTKEPGVGRRKSMGGDQIRALREKSNMSQAVFAEHLGLTTGYLSQLERDAKTASGPTLALLDVITRNGIGVVTSFKIENDSEADEYLTDLLKRPEYRSMDEITRRAQKYVEDGELRKRFINRGKQMLEAAGSARR